jgi:hypothetical protein
MGNDTGEYHRSHSAGIAMKKAHPLKQTFVTELKGMKVCYMYVKFNSKDPLQQVNLDVYGIFNTQF